MSVIVKKEECVRSGGVSVNGRRLLGAVMFFIHFVFLKIILGVCGKVF